GRTSPYAERQHLDRTLPRPLRHDDDIAGPERVVGLADHDAVHIDRARGAEARGERAALREACEPQPLIKPPARLVADNVAPPAHANLSCLSLAKGWPSAAVLRRAARRGRSCKRRGRATNSSSPSRISAR